MAEEIIHIEGTKEEKYKAILPQIFALIEHEDDLIANLANVSAVLKETLNFFWVGFYLVKKDELVLGPFQGSLACTRIAFGKGVCGAAWKQKATILVPDVDLFPGHIACSSLSRSEIVVPISKVGEIVAVLDVDSDKENDFDLIDKKYLEELCAALGNIV
jgi:L-methionine (R)-S-oxide reductase